MLAQAVLQFSRMARRGDRTAFAQTLRTHARSCSVDLCRDDASRARVTAMVEGVRASTGPTADKRGAEKAFKQYEATFDEQPQYTPTPATAKKGLRIRGRI